MNCFQNCGDDNNCSQRCFDNASSDARNKYVDIVNCYQNNCQYAENSDSCLNEQCGYQIEQCKNSGNDVCGDGNLTGNEACEYGWSVSCRELGYTSGAAYCNSDCTGLDESNCFYTEESYCGNGILEDGEKCDDGNNYDGDGCSSYCYDEESNCFIPEDFFTVISKDYFMFNISGIISENSVASNYLSDLSLFGKSYKLENAMIFPYENKIVLYLYTTIDSNKIRLAEVIFDKDMLKKYKEINQQKFFVSDADVVAVFDMDISSSDIQRTCVTAVSDKNAYDYGSFFNCNQYNNSFDIGETLNMAGNIALTTDPTAISSVMNNQPAPTLDENLCYCSDSAGNIIPCP